MICPQCRGEYREGFSRCESCNVELVEPSQLATPDHANIELVTIFRGADPGEIALAESLLVSAGIRYSKKNDALQDLFGPGRLGAGFNVAIGPAEIQVDRNDGPRALTLLEDILEAEAGESVEEI